jgi:Na+-transporting NADH:ubiquinone oxidoreductase subunit C
MNKEGTLYTILFVFIVSFLFVFLLSLANQATIERVELNQQLARQRAVLSAFGIPADDDDEVQDLYASVRSVADGAYLEATVEGRTAVAVEFAGPGLWGTIAGVLAVDESVERIIGLEIVSDNETPGLGARINEDWFKEQFRGELVGADGLEVTVLEGDGDTDRDNSVVDAVTGATRSSEAMEDIINTELERIRSLLTTTGQGGQQ